MRDTIFATVNNFQITGNDILYMHKRIANENAENATFAQTPNDDNIHFIYSEALQKLIELNSLVCLAKFEGISVSDEDVSNTIYELRSSYEDDFDWETALDDLGINDKNIRDVFYKDLMVDRLILSHMDNFEDSDHATIEDFYEDNINSMTLPDKFSFIEVEIKDPSLLQIAATILSGADVATMMQEAQKYNIEFSINEEIPMNKLPETLQEVFKDLQENKIGSVPMEDESLVLIKLLKKIEGKVLSLEEASDGINEYLKYQQSQDLLDQLTSAAIDKCDINYLNTDSLKDLI